MRLTKLVNFIFLPIVCILLATNANSAAIEYTQLTSTQNQPAINASNLVAFETVDGIQNIGSALNKVVIKDSGFYFIMAVGQAGLIKSDASGTGYVDLWLIKNGTPLPNTGTRQGVNAEMTGSIVTQAIIQLNAGDSLSIGFSASNPSFGLLSIPATASVPTVTSFSLTIYKI
ncbi:MAG: hypothetical protein Q8R83_05375 [Legionellaceae bacterium]|nr:hypothetical protein [Legionellaceae bacterium]